MMEYVGETWGRGILIFFGSSMVLGATVFGAIGIKGTWLIFQLNDVLIAGGQLSGFGLRVHACGRHGT